MRALSNSKTNESKDGKENLGRVRDALYSLKKTFCRNVGVKSIPDTPQVSLTSFMMRALRVSVCVCVCVCLCL